MARQQPRLPTQVGKTATGKATIAVKERIAYTKIQVNKTDLVGKDGTLDAERICRILTQMQDNVHTATAPARNDPTSNKKIIQQIAFTKGSPVRIQHNLGAPVGAWFPTRAYHASDPFSAVESKFGSGDWPTSLNQAQWIVLEANSTGTYDIAFCPA